MALATALKAVFLVLECGICALYLYAVNIDPPAVNFIREITQSPWMMATVIDALLILVPIALWIYYKESNWILSALRIIPLFILGSPISCGYIVIQLMELSPQESMQDPIFHVLLSKKDKRRSNCTLSVVSARLLFITLGSLIAGTFVYTAITDGSPFRSGILTPWFTAVLVDCYINSIIISVWIAYKEQSWISAVFWIVLLMCFRSVVSSAYIMVQLFRLSPQDPASLVLFNDRIRNEDEGSIEALI